MSGLGRVTYRESGQPPFINRDGTRERYHSEETAREIDEEIQRILEESSEFPGHTP